MVIVGLLILGGSDASGSIVSGDSRGKYGDDDGWERRGRATAFGA